VMPPDHCGGWSGAPYCAYAPVAYGFGA
jgi:hypothetical protein